MRAHCIQVIQSSASCAAHATSTCFALSPRSQRHERAPAVSGLARCNISPCLKNKFPLTKTLFLSKQYVIVCQPKPPEAVLEHANPDLDHSSKIDPLAFSLESVMPLLTPVLEKPLLDFVALDVVTNTRICLTDRGFIFVFHLRKIDGLHSLYVSRGGWPRTWKSLDRMITWLRERGLLFPSMGLQIASPIQIDPPKPKGNPPHEALS